MINRYDMRRYCNRGLVLAAVVVAAGWFWVTYSTRGALAYDGSIDYGFPVPFAGFGCGPLIVNGSHCAYDFSSLRLVLDLVLSIGFPALASVLVARYDKHPTQG